MHPIVDTTVNNDASGQGSTHMTFPTGIRVRSGVPLCVADVNQGSPNAFATVHGLLIRE
jgi:hypothetical protein